MRARWLIVAGFFFINVAAAVAAGRWVGAGVCALLAFALLGVGFLDAGDAGAPERGPSPVLDPEDVEAAIEALAELVALKDGLKDAAYEAAKPLAWQKGRDALSRLAAGRLTGAAPR